MTNKYCQEKTEKKLRKKASEKYQIFLRNKIENVQKDLTKISKIYWRKTSKNV